MEERRLSPFSSGCALFYVAHVKGDEMSKDSGTVEKPRGRFSRRHVTSEAHFAATERYRAEHGKEARRRKAAEREVASAKRTPAERIETLNKRLGRGKGAARERARLKALLPKKKK